MNEDTPMDEVLARLDDLADQLVNDRLAGNLLLDDWTRNHIRGEMEELESLLDRHMFETSI
jgi:hypothetical protein